MRPSDVIVEVRLKSFGRVGQVPLEDVRKAQFIKRFNTTGAWTITMPDVTAVSQTLKNPGAGIIVWLYGQPWLSGPMVNYTRAKTTSDTKGLTTFVGVDDMVLLSDPLLYPVPSQPDVTQQTDDYDDRSGACETVLKAYLNANVGPSAGVLRRPVGTLLSGLTIEADQGRGGRVKGSARFDKPGLFFQTLCTAEGTVGFDVLQLSGMTGTQFRCYQVQDRSGLVRMDVDNDMLKEVDSGIAAPSTTVAIVAGQGVGAARTFVQYTDSLSNAAQTAWGRRIETFIDQRQTNDQTQLNQAGTKEIETNGRTTVSLKVSPTDNTTMLLGRDWNPGDLVGVIVDGQSLVDVVTEAIVSIDQSSVKVAATVGDPSGYDWEAAVTTLLTDYGTRLDSLERNSETGTATTTTIGQVQLSSVTTAQAGTDTSTAVTPAGAAAVASAKAAAAVAAIPIATTPKGVGIFLSTALNLTGPAANGIPLDVTEYNDDTGTFSVVAASGGSGGYLYFPKAGLYLVNYYGIVQYGGGGTFYLGFSVNGNNNVGHETSTVSTNGLDSRVTGVTTQRFAAGTSIGLRIYGQNNCTIAAAQAKDTGLRVVWLGP